MISDLITGLLGGLVNILNKVLLLLPQVDVSAFGIEPNESIRNILSTVNVFIPLKQVVAILGIWAGLVLTTNVVFMVKGIVNRVASK